MLHTIDYTSFIPKDEEYTATAAAAAAAVSISTSLIKRVRSTIVPGY